MEPDLTEQIAEFLRNRFFGKYRGTVESSLDLTGRGRLDVKVPAVLGDEIVTAMPCVPYAGDGVGLHLLPESGTGVWVEFEGGDVSYPIWTGFFWADGELPENAMANLKILKTDASTFSLDDISGEILMQNNLGASITMTTDIEHDAGGKVTVSPAEVKAKAGVASVTVDSGGVTASSGGVGEVAVSPSGTSVNAGAVEVT